MQKNILRLVMLMFCIVYMCTSNYTFAEEIELDDNPTSLYCENSYDNYINSDNNIDYPFNYYDYLPVYNGPIVELDASLNNIKDFISGNGIDDGLTISVNAASLFIEYITKNEKETFCLWSNIQGFTQPISVLLSIEDIKYGYLFGIVDENNKLVGYIVAGNNIDYCPILEFSCNPEKYLYFCQSKYAIYSYNNGLIRIDDKKESFDKKTIEDNDIQSLEENPTEGLSEWLSFYDQVSSIDIKNKNMSLNYNERIILEEQASTQKRVNMDTSDYTWQTLCTYTSCSMFFDAIGRRIEPGLLGHNRPHSIQLNASLHSYMGHHPSFNSIKNYILNWASQNKMSSTLLFTSYYYHGNNNSSFYNYKQIIDDDVPALVGYDSSEGAHIMLGIGYSSNSYYIVRDTFTGDGKPINSSDYYFSKSGYNYHVLGLTYSSTNSSTEWGKQTLRLGDSNFNVKRLRNMLYLLYYEPGSLSSTYFDTSLENAVKQFQADQGLTSDGIVGPNTYKKLIRAHIMRYDNLTVNWRILRQGTKGDDVAQLQIRLFRMGYYQGICDGIFGTTTKNAVINYQTAKGLTADGIVGVNTFAKLYGLNSYMTSRYYLPCSVCSN